jgi:hypothetical protein
MSESAIISRSGVMYFSPALRRQAPLRRYTGILRHSRPRLGLFAVARRNNFERDHLVSGHDALSAAIACIL